MNVVRGGALVTLAALTASAAAETDPKSRYNLFHPTPPGEMRELSADRPDRTETPYTVDAGHFQIEMDLVTFAYDRHNPEHADVEVTVWNVAPMNLKLGLLNNLDAEVILGNFVDEQVEDRTTGEVDGTRGFGDVIVRLKLNLWGNDEGRTALALLPFLKLPTSSAGLGNNAVEGGVIVPFALELPHGWSLGMTSGMAFVRGEDGGYDTDFINSLALGHDLFWRLAGYAEFYSVVSTGGGDWIGTADFGITCLWTDNLQLDAGVNVGVTRAAPDLQPFVGLTWRY